MEKSSQPLPEFQPELYCLRCQQMEWDEEDRRCLNFESACCPLAIRSLLAGLEVSCMVV